MKKLLDQQGDELLIAGTWILTIGTVISAAGQTRLVATGDLSGKESTVIGNSVEGFGNVLQAVGRGKIDAADPSFPGKLAEVGCWLQAGGNVTNAVGIQQEIIGERGEQQFGEGEEGNSGGDTEENSNSIFEQIEEQGSKINALGSTVQAGGAILEAYGIANMKPSFSTSYEVIGNTIIGFGSAIDAIGTIYILQDQEKLGNWIELAGAYIQVVGSAIELYGVTVESMLPEEEEDDTEDNQERYTYKVYNRK